MKCVGKTILYRPCSFLPLNGVAQPSRAVGDERPRTNVGNARRERIDVAVGAIGQCHLLGEPVLRNFVRAGGQVPVEVGNQLGMALAGNLAVVRNLTDVPEQSDVVARRGDIGDFAIGAQRFERGDVVGRAGARQTLLARELTQ